MRFVYPIIFIVLFLSYDYTNTLFTRHICGISITRGKEFRKYSSKVFESEEDKDTSEWWRSKFLIDGFNEACNNIFQLSEGWG